MASSARIDELRKKFDENPRRYFAPLANEYRKAGDLEQAIFICQEYLPQQPGHMSGHIVYGQALFELTRLDESRQVFETALSLDPENLIALRHLGDIARQTGDSRAARGWYQRVLEADPRNEEIAQIMMTLLSTPAGPQPGVEHSAVTTVTVDVAEPAESDEAAPVVFPVDEAAGEPGFSVEKSEDRSGLAVGPELSALPERQPTPAAVPAVPPTPSWSQKIPDSELLDLNDFTVGGIPLTELGVSPSIDQPLAPEPGTEEPSHYSLADAALSAEAAAEAEPEMISAPADDEAGVDTNDLPFEADPFAIAAAPRAPEEQMEEEVTAAASAASPEVAPPIVESFDERMAGLETFEHGVAPPEEETAALEFEAFFMPGLDAPAAEAPRDEPAIVAQETTEPELVVETSAPELEPFADLSVPSFESDDAPDVASVIDIGVPDLERASEPIESAIDPAIEPLVEIFETPVLEPAVDAFDIPVAAPIAEMFEMPSMEPPVDLVFDVSAMEPVSEVLEVFEVAAEEPVAEAFEASVVEEPAVIDFDTPAASYAAIETDAEPMGVAELSPQLEPELEPQPAANAWDASFEIPTPSDSEAASLVPEAFVTETMADLYLQQGHAEAALEIYQKLVEQRPHDQALRDRLRLIEDHVRGPTTPFVAAQAIEPLPAVAAGPTIREFLSSLLMPRVTPTDATEESAMAYAWGPGDDGVSIDDAATPVSSAAVMIAPDEPASIEEDFGEPFVPSPTPTDTPAHDALAIPVVDAAIDAIVDFSSKPMTETILTPEPVAEQVPEPSPVGEQTPEPSPTLSRGTPSSAGETVRGSIDALFSGAGASSNDNTAASTLAEAYSSETPEPPLQGVPAHKAASELSLDHVFKTGQAPRSEAENDGFSFDQFFADDLAEGATKSGNTPPANPRQGADDIAQFNNWLNGLKKT